VRRRIGKALKQKVVATEIYCPSGRKWALRRDGSPVFCSLAIQELVRGKDPDAFYFLVNRAQ